MNTLNQLRGTRPKRVFISGPMSGLPEHNYPAFFAAAEELRSKGYDPINPAEGAPQGWTWGMYIRRSLKLLADADEIYMLPGWSHSRGARLELYVAKELGIPFCIYFNLKV